MMRNRPFARGHAATAASPIRRRGPFSRDELDLFLPLHGYWERRERRPLGGAGDLDYQLCVQIADAVEFAEDESHRWWLPHAYLEHTTDWRTSDVLDLDDLFQQVRTSAGLEPEDALKLAQRAGALRLPCRWRGGSPTIAAGFEDAARGAWLANHRRGGDEQLLTTWVWLCAAYLEVPWDATPCTWCGEPYALTSAMAHVAGRVVGRTVVRDNLGHLYGHAGVGGSAFALQLVATGQDCGLGGPERCEECPLIEGCAAFETADFPFA